MAWLRHRDPELLAVRRSIRVTLAATTGFFVCRYVIGDPVMATYALFGAIALGFLSQVPGPPPARAATLLWSLPVALLLIVAGTLVAGNVLVATLGILVFGFAVAYAGVGGPRLVGLSAGMQLLFILPCFPPYEPGTLVSRLIGACIGIGLLALTELTVWPDPYPVAYSARLAQACERLAEHVEAHLGGDRAQIEATLVTATEQAEALRMSRLPPQVRPASASRRDRAFSHAGSMLRFALDQLHMMSPSVELTPAAVALLQASARTAHATATALHEGTPSDTDQLGVTVAQAARGDTVGVDEVSARMSAFARASADSVWVLANAVRVAMGVPVGAESGSTAVRRDRFPYAYASPVRLWWQRLSCHLTPQSVYFQGAVRMAAALGAARLIAGLFDVSHGFWVLLATLTLLRSRAVDTRTALWPTVLGTVAGAAVAGVLLAVVGDRLNVYAALMPPTMLVAFAAGAVFDQVWGQALFTLVVSMVFTQIAPDGWRLAEIRAADVLLGALVGIGAGVLAWPRGGGGELRRSSVNLLDAGGDTVCETTAVLTSTAQPSDALPRTRRRLILAEASYAMYLSERSDLRMSTMDYQQVIVTGYHIVGGAESLLDSRRGGSLTRWRRELTTKAAFVADTCHSAAAALSDTTMPVPLSNQATEPAVGDGGSVDGGVIDVQVWLDGVANDVSQIDSRRRT